MKNTLIQSLESNDTFTENGMLTHSTSSNSCLDFFFVAGALRKEKDENRIYSYFIEAYKENPLTAMKILFWARDIRGGAGERRLFRVILSNIPVSNKKLIQDVLLNLEHVPEYGRWDDLVYIMFNSKVIEIKTKILSLIKEALINKNGLCAKWMPRKGYEAKVIREYLKLSPKEYRKLIVSLTDVVEQKMCKKEWNKIEFKKVPSLAISRYNKCFYKNTLERYKEYVESLVNNTTKINVGAIYPYDILKSLNQSNSATTDEICQQQWINLPNYMENSTNFKVLPLIDVSGSMSVSVSGSTTAMDIAVSLGLYLSERNDSDFKNYFITFSSVPELVKIKGDTLKSKFSSIIRSNWDMTTDLLSAFNLILNKAVKDKVKPEDMPTHLLILSDMEFNSAMKNRNAIESIRKLYKKYGYEIPNVVFWNLNSRHSNFPIKYDENNVALISGFSPSIVKSVLSGNINPIDSVMVTVNSDRYNLIKIKE